MYGIPDWVAIVALLVWSMIYCVASGHGGLFGKIVSYITVALVYLSIPYFFFPQWFEVSALVLGCLGLLVGLTDGARTLFGPRRLLSRR